MARARRPYVAPTGVVGQYIRYTFTIRQTGKFVAPNGRFISLNKTTARAIAIKMQDAAVEQLKKERKRRGGTGRLRRAIRSEQNVLIGAKSIRLFRVAYLDQQVPYWRAIDQGLSVGFVGRKVPGFFHSGGEVTGLGEGTRQAFTWSGMGYAARRMREDGVAGKPLMVIQNPIKPEHYVRAARDAFTTADASLIAQGIIDDFKLKRRD